MEVIGFIDSEAHYIREDGIESVYMSLCKTPMFGVIKINGMSFKCMPADRNNLCGGCHFYDEQEGCLEIQLPCYSSMREDCCNCIFKKVDIVKRELVDKNLYSSDELREYLNDRFK